MRRWDASVTLPANTNRHCCILFNFLLRKRGSLYYFNIIRGLGNFSLLRIFCILYRKSADMEMPELNEDILEGESNQEMLNQTEDTSSRDELSLQTESQIPMDTDSNQVKNDGEKNESKVGELQQDENTVEDSELKNENEEAKENITQGEETTERKDNGQDDEEPAQKKLKLEDEKIEEADGDGMQQLQMKEESEQETILEAETPAQNQINENESQSEAEAQEVKKENEEKQEAVIKEGDKPESGPDTDTDMLVTLASAALEQDPKDKATTAPTPKSPAKSETETPKKKPELWCNVGVFDTNTTIVSDYVATPEPNEHVDLVTATLGGRRIQLEPGTAYKFRVCAVNGCGTGPWSDVAAFKTTLPGFPGAPSAIKISTSPEGAHLTWEPPGGNSSEILEYAVYMAVRSASQGCQPVTTNQAQLAFVRVFCGPTNKCVVGTNSLQAAHIDTTTKPAIIFRILARNSKGYGPATQVRWLQESQNGTPQGVKRAVKA